MTRGWRGSIKKRYVVLFMALLFIAFQFYFLVRISTGALPDNEGKGGYLNNLDMKRMNSMRHDRFGAPDMQSEDTHDAVLKDKESAIVEERRSKPVEETKSAFVKDSENSLHQTQTPTAMKLIEQTEKSTTVVVLAGDSSRNRRGSPSEDAASTGNVVEATQSGYGGSDDTGMKGYGDAMQGGYGGGEEPLCRPGQTLATKLGYRVNWHHFFFTCHQDVWMT